jgi:hypothetical protein
MTACSRGLASMPMPGTSGKVTYPSTSGGEFSCSLPLSQPSGAIRDYQAQSRYDLGDIAPLKSKVVK